MLGDQQEPDEPGSEGLTQEGSPTDPDREKDYREMLEMVEERYEELGDKWHKDGKTVWKIYGADTGEAVPFNILYSNTETIVPAIFSRKPIARVFRRFDEVRADVPAKAVQRMLTFAMDTNLPSYPDFMTAIDDAVMDACLPGQGMFRVRNVGGIACLDYVEWNTFVWGYCPRWERCPWIAFCHDMTPDEVLAEFSATMTPDQLAYFTRESKGTSKADTEKDTTDEDRPFTVRVWEVWDKQTRNRHFLCEAATNCCLETKPDPLGLENFFPVPRPLRFLRNTTDTMPRPLYRLYQDQAQELNELTLRLQKVVKAIKVRGVYAGNLPEIAMIFNESEDNTIIPAEASSNILTMNKGLDAYIWLIPIEQLMKVATELYAARDAVKQTIYEILGIGDILRGVTKASETLGAQQLKDKWGSLRINSARETTAEFIRDGLRLLAEVAVKHTPEVLWAKITAMPLMPAVQAQANQPPDPMATWPGVLSVLKQDVTRSYLIDIETNSSVDPESTEEKAEMADFMNALGQAMAGLQTLMAESPEGFALGKQILIGITGKYDLGNDLEPLLRNLPVPQALQGPPPQIVQMQQDLQKRLDDVSKREQAVTGDEANVKDMVDSASQIQATNAQTQNELQMRREAFRREQDMAQQLLDLKQQQAALEVMVQKLALEKDKAAFAGEKAAVQAQAKVNSQNKPRPAGAK